MKQNALFWLRVGVIIIGTALMGLGISFLVKSRLGADPWTIFFEGLTVIINKSGYFHTTLGRTNQIFGLCLVIILFIIQRRKPSLYNLTGTILSFILIGFFIDLFLGYRYGAYEFLEGEVWLINSQYLGFRIMYMFIGILIVAIGIGLYVGGDLGQGAIEMLMMYVHHKTGWSIAISKILLDGFAVLVGYLLGGVLGIGTLIAVIAIGPIVNVILRYTHSVLKRLET